MILQIMIPGVDQYLSRGIQQLGDTLSLFFDTDRKTQRAIRDMLIQNPQLIQNFADLESRAPGSLHKLGFGKIADMVSGVPPSMDVQRERRLGQRTLDVEEQELAFKEFRNQAVQAEITRNPTISALEMGAMFSEMLGIPRRAQLQREDFELMPLQLQADRALAVMNAAEQGNNVEGAISDYVAAFRAGMSDPQVIGSIMSHPLLGPQFDALYELAQNRENADLQRELSEMRIDASTTGVSAVTKREIDMAGDIKYSINEARRLLAERPQGVGARFIIPESTRAVVSAIAEKISPRLRGAILDPEGVPLRAWISEINTTLFHLRSGTAVTANEKKRLEPLTPNIWDAPDVVIQKLNGLDQFFNEYVGRRQGLLREISTGGSISGPVVELRGMIDSWLKQGMSDDEVIQRYNNELTKLLEKREQE